MHQQAQHVVFLRRQLHLALAHPDDAAHEIDRELAGPEERALAADRELVAERVAHPGSNSFMPKGLVT